MSATASVLLYTLRMHSAPFLKLRTLLLALVFLTPLCAYADTTTSLPCSNPHVATADEAAAGGGGIIAGVTMVCPSDAQLGITDAAGAAKAYLLSIAKDLRGSQAPPDKAHIDLLNNSFAICAANFLKAYIQSYGPVNVVSAFRCGPITPANITCDRTENARAGGATNSNHQLGVAVDINPAGGNSSYDTLRSFAQANPGYGVTFPWPFYNGSTDKNHMQAINKSSPSCSGVAGTPVTPSAGTASPPQQISNVIRQALGLQQPQSSLSSLGTQAVQAVAAQTQTGTTGSTGSSQTTTQTSQTGSPTACTPSYSCSNNIYYYQTSSCTTLAIQQCPYGCNGDSCAPAPANSPTTSQNTSGTPSTQSASSAIDIIRALANPTVVSATVTPAVLNQDIGNIASPLAEGAATPPSSDAANTQTATLEPTGVQQTFTSTDLANSPAPSSSSSQNSFAQSVLQSMAQSLIWALNYLKPFAGVTSSQAYAE